VRSSPASGHTDGFDVSREIRFRVPEKGFRVFQEAFNPPARLDPQHAADFSAREALSDRRRFIRDPRASVALDPVRDSLEQHRQRLQWVMVEVRKTDRLARGLDDLRVGQTSRAAM